MIRVFDYFSGCGGTSKGLENAGMEIVFALDNDPDAIASFQNNFPAATTSNSDIQHFNYKILADLIDSEADKPTLFACCAPCQPFTKLNTQQLDADPRLPLMDYFGLQVEFFRPDYVFIENVPGIRRNENKDSHINRFMKMLRRLGYQYDAKVVLAQNYGVPQHRQRFFLVASKGTPITIPEATHGDGNGRKSLNTVRDYIYGLPEINAGEAHQEIELHVAASLSDLNLKRISATQEGGSRLDWPEDLVLDCHKNGHNGHTDVYGRMKWDKPAPALTTRCISLSNGRFGHPTQDRAISLLEAALLQTFPEDYIFVGPMVSKARQIGNAVPVKLAETFGDMFVNHLKMTKQESIAKNV